MPVLLAQCALPPVLLALVSWLQRRRGPALGGLLAGLPLTSGPIVLSVAIEHGPGFAARTATATLGGAASASALCWAYARTARRGGPGRALAAGCAVFAAGSAVQQTAHPAPAAIALTGFLTVAVVLLRWPGYQAADAAAAPGSPLAVRAALVTCYVLAAAALSPRRRPAGHGPVLAVPRPGRHPGRPHPPHLRPRHRDRLPPRRRPQHVRFPGVLRHAGGDAAGRGGGVGVPGGSGGGGGDAVGGCGRPDQRQWGARALNRGQRSAVTRSSAVRAGCAVRWTTDACRPAEPRSSAPETSASTSAAAASAAPTQFGAA